MKDDLKEYSKCLKKMRKKQKYIRTSFNIFTSTVTVLSVGGTAVGATGIGMIIGGPIIGVGTIFGLCSLISSKMDKNVSKEIIKYEKLITLINSKMTSMGELLNKSLKDGKISEEEYKLLNYENEQYEIMKLETLSGDEKNSLQQNMSTKEMEKITELVAILRK